MTEATTESNSKGDASAAGSKTGRVARTRRRARESRGIIRLLFGGGRHGGTLFFTRFCVGYNWREAIELTPDFEPERNLLEENPAFGPDALAEEAVAGPVFDMGFAIADGDIGFGRNNDAEASIAIVGGVNEDDLAAEGADGDTGPADELNGGPAFELEADGAAGCDGAIGVFVTLGNEGHVHAVDPHFDESAFGLRDDDADGGAGAKVGAVGGSDAEDDAVPRSFDDLLLGLIDLNVDGGDVAVGGGELTLGGTAAAFDAGDGGVHFSFRAFENGFGGLEIGFGAVDGEFGEFEVALGDVAGFEEFFDALEIELVGVERVLLGEDALASGVDGLAFGEFHLSDLGAEVFDALLSGGFAGDGGIMLEAHVGEEIGIVVLNFEEDIALFDALVFNDVEVFDAASDWGFDVDAAVEGIEGDDATGATDELLPGHEEDGGKDE